VWGKKGKHKGATKAIIQGEQRGNNGEIEGGYKSIHYWGSKGDRCKEGDLRGQTQVSSGDKRVAHGSLGFVFKEMLSRYMG
jgi:hypothetical protein